MNNADNHDLLKLVNSSGFPFQERVRYEIQRNTQQHGWAEASFEHRWKVENTDKEGYIDLILENEEFRAVLECKRARQGKWIFLIPQKEPFPTMSRFLATVRKKDSPSFKDFLDCRCILEIDTSSFCVIRGSGENDEPMLERVAGKLMRSIENLASEELLLCPIFEDAWLYIPVIVTTAELILCEYDPRKADLVSGEIKENDCDFRSVDFLRFQKSLFTSLSMMNKIKFDKIADLKKSNEASQRTVFIVHASGLIEFLKGIRSAIKTPEAKKYIDFCREHNA